MTENPRGIGGYYLHRPDGSDVFVTHSSRVAFAGGVLTKRGGVITERRVRSWGKPVEYPWGERQPVESLERIVCSHCDKLIAQDISWEAVRDLADAQEAWFEPESDVWAHAWCREEFINDMWREAAAHEWQMDLAAIQREEQDALDAMLEAGDLLRKERKENG